METKTEKFERVASKRLNNVLESLDTFEKVFDLKYYDWNMDEAQAMFDKVVERLDIIKRKAL